jgi:hypothetical protein
LAQLQAFCALGLDRKARRVLSLRDVMQGYAA